MSVTITYLRAGRQMRASGTVIEKDEDTRMTKVKPSRADWGMIWITAEEFAAGQEKPPIRPREKKDGPEKPKRVIRKPKPQLLPRWKQLVEQVRIMEIDHAPDGWPGVKMQTLTELADELEAAHSNFLPLNHNH